MITEIPWEDDALQIGPADAPVTVRYTFGNVAAYDAAAARAGAPPMWAALTAGPVGFDAAGRFLRHFAETDAGGPAYATEAAALDGLRALGLPAVLSAFVTVHNRTSEEFGFVPVDSADGGGAEGKG